MTEIRFYHLERQSQDQVLPMLIAKALDGGKRLVIKTSNDAEAEHLNEHLWTYHPDSFLPHGSKKDGNAALQPVWLTSKDENPNGADVLILTHGSVTEIAKDFSLCCEMLDGHDESAVAEARTRWKSYVEAGHKVTYWKQSERGWEEKTGK